MKNAFETSGGSPPSLSELAPRTIMNTAVMKCPVTNKRSFAGIGDAEQFEQQNREKYNDTPRQYAYECPNCGNFHLTKSPPTETNSNNYTRVRFPKVSEETLSPHEQVEQRRQRVLAAIPDTSKSYKTIAAELGINEGTLHADVNFLIKKGLAKGTFDKKTPVSQSPAEKVAALRAELAARKAELEAAEQELQAAETARLERERLKLDWILTPDGGKAIQVFKNGTVVIHSTSAWREILTAVESALGQYERKEITFPDVDKLAPGTIISGERAGQMHGD